MTFHTKAHMDWPFIYRDSVNTVTYAKQQLYGIEKCGAIILIQSRFQQCMHHVPWCNSDHLLCRLWGSNSSPHRGPHSICVPYHGPALTLHVCRSAGPAHVSTTPPGGWQAAFDLAGARTSSLSECPICFDYMHQCGSRRPSSESERRSLESAAPQSPACKSTCSWLHGDAAEGAAAMHSQQADEGQSSGSPGASTSSNPAGGSLLLEGEPSAVVVRTCSGRCSSSEGGGGASCGSCSTPKVDDAAPHAPRAVEVGSDVTAGGQVLRVVVPSGTTPYDGSAVMSTGSYTSGGTASDEDSDINAAAAVRVCHDVEPASGCPHEHDGVILPDGTTPPQRLPVSMSSPVPLVSLVAAAPVGAPGSIKEGSSDVEGNANGQAAGKFSVPSWLKEDLVVTDCGHVFHSVCLLRHEHALAARAETSASSPQCPVCRRVYRRYLGAMCAAHQ